MTIDPSAFSGYASHLYERVEDLAEIADWSPHGPKQDAAVNRYLDALHAICRLRGNHAVEHKAAAELRTIVADERIDRYPPKAA